MPEGASGQVEADANPLEALRVTSEPAKRAALLQALDNAWSDWEALYRRASS